MTFRYILVLTFCAVAFSAFAAEPQAAVTVPSTDVDVAVPAHDIARGAIIGDGDLVYKSVSVATANASVARAIADISGQEARRSLRTGEFVRTSDVKRPTIVAKGATVTMTFEAPGISLIAVGRAMAEGGEGETISVLNPVSFRQVQAMVTGPGQVRVGGSSLAENHSASVVAAAQQ